MIEKNIKSRIQQKHDIEANWLKAENFIPMRGELIIYDIDANYDYERMKIGDGATSVVELPFIVDGPINNMELITVADIDAICGSTIQMVSEVTF